MMRTYLSFPISKLILLFSISVMLSLFSQAQITGGQISFSSTSLMEYRFTCLIDCSPGASTTCQKEILNYSLPTGGSNRFFYTWQVDSGTGWKPIIRCSQTPNDSMASTYICLPQPKTLATDYQYRRKVKNQLNPNDSAFSNIIHLQANIVISGSLNFTNGNSWETIQIGTTPPNVRATGVVSTENSATYHFEKQISSSYWQRVSNVPYTGPSATFYPPTQDTTGLVTYRGQIDNICPYEFPDHTNYVYIQFIDTLFVRSGKIAGPSIICPGLTVNLLGTTATQVSPPFNYQWQYSTDGWNWNNVSNATNLNYSDSSFSQTRYYRRVVIKGIYNYYSNIIKVVPGNTTTNPNVFGSNRWNIYCYSGIDLTLVNLTYLNGYYTSDSTNIRTSNDWAPYLSPSFAQNYTGCAIDTNNFTIVAKRQGFDPGSYVLHVPQYNGSFSITLNGVLIYNDSCCNNTLPYINLGNLNSSSKIEVKHSSTFGNGNLEMEFIKIITRPTNYISDSCRTFSVITSAMIRPVHLIDSVGKVISSVNPYLVKLGLISINIKHSPPGSSNIPVDANGVYYMPRYYNFSSSSYGDNNFSSPIRIKLLFLKSEFDDYKNALNNPLLTYADLRVLHYDGSNEDCDRSNNTAAGVLLTPIDTGAYGSDGFYLEVEVSSFSEFGVIANNSPLPIHWISASAAKKSNNIFVQWKVAKEDQTKRYEVLRSSNGISYSVSGIVERKSVPSSPAAYTFTDPVLEKSDYLYYRIKQINQDNRYILSPVMKVKINNEKDIVLYPNPAKNYTLLSAKSIIQQVTIIDGLGKVLQTIVLNATTTKLNTSNLSKGVYLLKVKLTNGEDQTIKMIKE